MPKTTSYRRRLPRARTPRARPGSATNKLPVSYHPTVSQDTALQQQVPGDEALRWQMRWFFAIAIAIWIPTAMAVTIVVFWLTKNPYSLSLFSTLGPPVYFLHRFAKYLLPRDEREFQLAALRIQKSALSPSLLPNSIFLCTES